MASIGLIVSVRENGVEPLTMGVISPRQTLPRGRWENVLDDTTIEGGRPVEVAELMPRWPLALLVQPSDCHPDEGPATAG